ncbi:MAG: long-chain-fatty-acid--CoA ligase [Thermodesulfobacteriota bacterium]|nr:long-chain-fatty-acid--CoA ligase [Thermodesulfobacteriota bacterium]
MKIPFILEKALSLYAEREAVAFEEKRFTYRQFADRVYQLAHFFKASGIERGDCVAILHHNSNEFLECYFATAQLGAILNPLNYRLSPEELAHILEDSGAIVLIAAERYSTQVRDILNQDIHLEIILCTGENDGPLPFNSLDYEEILEKEEAAPPPLLENSDEEVAYLYYTSGTTGQPKGVMLSHENVCTHALAAIAELKLGDHDRWIHVAPLFHLADAWATFAITWVGGRHVIVRDFEPLLVLSTIQNEKVTITNMIPTMLNEIINTPNVKTYDFSSLRAILSGGAPIAPEVVKKIMETFQCDYIQTYGMTETSPYLTLSILKEHLTRLPPEKQFFYKARTGRPFLGTLLKVVRDDGEEVTPDDNEVGEIIVKGDTVTKGYWKKPLETARVLKDGWLYTGDLAVVDEEGYVNIVDRKKDMIITGGENVYSIEVENLLYTHPSILEAAVIGVPDPKWGEAVKAVIVLKEGHKSTEEEIIQYCKQRIAHYKAPKSVDLVPELSKTGTGKIFKKELKKKYMSKNQVD